MIQEITHNAGQVTQDGNIIVCQGGSVCPIAAANEPESKLQSEFAERTGIWCPREAREVFEDLMRRHGFVARELYVAWQAGNVVYERATRRLQVRASWFEAAFGYAMLILMGLYLVFQVGGILTSTASALSAAAAILLSAMLYLGSAAIAARFIIRPHHVAKRVRRALDEAPEAATSQMLARVTTG